MIDPEYYQRNQPIFLKCLERTSQLELNAWIENGMGMFVVTQFDANGLGDPKPIYKCTDVVDAAKFFRKIQKGLDTESQND